MLVVPSSWEEGQGAKREEKAHSRFARTKTPHRGSKPTAQGSALGKETTQKSALQGQKRLKWKRKGRLRRDIFQIESN